MRRTRLILPALLAIGLLASMLPAGAHDFKGEHPGTGSGDAGSHQNMRHVANVPRSSDQFQSDLAFQGNLVFAGNYNGFRIIDAKSPSNPQVIADVWCPGPQNDISVWGDLIVLSVDSVMMDDVCGSPPAPAPADPADWSGWEGLRIFSLADVLATPTDVDGFKRPQPITSVYTDCGSHTHTGYPQGDTLYLYVASYSLRGGPDCGPNNPGGKPALHEKVSIVEVPMADPDAHIVHTAPVDAATWFVCDYLPAGFSLCDPSQTPEGQRFHPQEACHDMQVHVGRELAAAACSSEGQLWDISDPLDPTLLWRVNEPDVQFYHSALFSEDGDTVIFGDEIIAGANCDDGSGAGQLWFHDIDDGTTLSSLQTDRDQGGAYCSAHLFNNIPSKKGSFLVASWYAAGTLVVDYTDPENPVEVAHFDPADTDSVRTSTWASYWYNGFIYANDGTATEMVDPGPPPVSEHRSRGVDIFSLSHKSKAGAGASKVGELNPQTQY